jgi:predicted DNA-binding antitoxin AbrB/MazE fold protein
MAKAIEVIYEDGMFKLLEKVDFQESTRMRRIIEPVKPKGLLKLAEELKQKQKEECIEISEDPLEVLIRMRERYW